MRLARSYLYVPGVAPARFDKAVGSGADAVILDLEDAVPLAQKDEARANVRGWLAGREPTGTQVWVRVNAGDQRRLDLAALEGVTEVTGLVLAKAGPAGDVADLAAALAERGCGHWLIHPLLETPAALLDARTLAALPQVERLQVGEYDLCAEVGVSPGEDELELQPMRGQVVLASAAAGALPPVAPVSIEIKDTGRFRRSTERAARQGFVGRACIHPAQLPTVHAVFTPDEATVDRARRTVATFERQVDAGTGVLIDDDGRLLDEAVVRRSRQVLALAGDRDEGGS